MKEFLLLLGGVAAGYLGYPYLHPQPQVMVPEIAPVIIAEATPKSRHVSALDRGAYNQSQRVSSGARVYSTAPITIIHPAPTPLPVRQIKPDIKNATTDQE